MTSTSNSQKLNAPRETVYRALLDPDAVSKWMVPDGMTSRVHAFEPREGGTFRISLTYDSPTGTGKTTSQTDTFHGTFTELIPNRKVVQVIEFETDNPAMMGAMTVTYALTDTPDGGTELRLVYDGLPPGVSAADNDLGTRMSLGKLAALVDGRS